MSYTEEDVKRAAEVKEWVESKISELEGELERLRGILALVNEVLRRASFKPAVAMAPEVRAEAPTPTHVVATVEYKEVHPLKRVKDGRLLANAYISESSVAIVPVSDIQLNISTPPFKSFLISRILEGMKGKDLESVSAGRLRPEEALSYTVEDEGGVIRKIVVNNYRDKGRLTEIFNTTTWAFTRMLEKTG